MLKQFFALARGRAYETAEKAIDHNALTILRQQIRDCAAAIDAARKAVAIAIAQNDQEIDQHKRLVVRIADLETRTIAATEQGKDALARQAAETIALLEGERDACEAAQKNFDVEIERMRRIVYASEMRLRELRRGERIAAAADRTQRLRSGAPSSSLSALKDAEETLTRLRMRQKEIDVASAALDEMERAADPGALAEKLAAAGCGAPVRFTAHDVLARLSARAGKSA
jgi:phage shock protein A